MDLFLSIAEEEKEWTIKYYIFILFFVINYIYIHLFLLNNKKLIFYI